MLLLLTMAEFEFLNQVHAWFLKIAFVHKVGVCVCVCVCACVCARTHACACVSAPEAINYIHVTFNLYNQLNKFVAFRNITKVSMHGRGLCNEV